MFVSAVKWSPLLVCLLTSLYIFTIILKDYPEYSLHRPFNREQQHEAKGLIKLEAGGSEKTSDFQHEHSPNNGEQQLPVQSDMAGTDTPMSNTSLFNGSVCVDYRKLDIVQAPQVVLQSPALPSKARVRKSLMAEDVYQVEKFVFIVGYPRSGHSIVGSIMDAHPNAVIAHEYNLFREWEKSEHIHSQRMRLYSSLFKNSVESAVSGWRSDARAEKGYTLGVGYKWQGSFTELKVIGDKSGAVTTQLFDTNPMRFMEALKELERTVRVPIRVIHVVRNPYDMISTRLLYADAGKKRKSKLPATENRKHCNLHGLSYQINRTFHLVSNVHKLLEKTNLVFLNVHHSDLVANPRETVSMMCRFLDLPYPEDYLDACAKKVDAKPSKTRLLVTWPQNMVEEVQRLSKPYSFLSRYSFEGS